MIDYKNISELIVDPENPRILKVKDEITAINYLININEESMFDLINNINNNGFFEQNIVSIVNENKELIILDGNRRIAAIKCLLNPELIENKQFKNRVEKIKHNRINNQIKIPCKLYKTRKEADIYIKTQHTKGGSVLKWSSIAQYYFLKEKTNVDYEKMHKAFKIYDSNFSKEENSKINNFSTIMRIIGKKEFNFLEKIDNKELKNILLKMVEDTNKGGGQTSRSLNNIEEREKYFYQLIKNEIGIEKYEKIKFDIISSENKKNLNKKLLIKKQKKPSKSHAFANFSFSNIDEKNEKDIYWTIYYYQKELTTLAKNYNNYPLSVNFLVRSVFEIGLKRWLRIKEIKNWDERSKLSQVVDFVKEKIKNRNLIFDKELDKGFLTFFDDTRENVKDMSNKLIHNSTKISEINKECLKILDTDYYYKLIYFIFNHKEDNEK